MNASIIHMYHPAKLDMSEYFRVESYLMSAIRITIAEEIVKMGEKYGVGKYPLLLLIYRRMCKIV